MKTGLGGTFVIPWAQTELEGIAAPPTHLLTAGATWRWTGQTLRLDGAGELLRLEDALGQDDLRRRAARVARRLVGAVPQSAPTRPGRGADLADLAPDNGFLVTDGRRAYTVCRIDPPGTGGPLALFTGEIPPRDQDLWIVRVAAMREPAVPAETGEGGVICFTPGTMLRTPKGLRPIETFRPGDPVLTKDNGVRPVVWSGHRRLSGARLHALPHLRPIRIRAGAFGRWQPDADLLVSPQHRMLVQGAASRALFDTPEVLVAAEDLLDDRLVTIDRSLREVTYVHVLLECHQIVWANGLETESFHPSHATLDTIDPVQRQALLAVLPALAADPLAYGAPARRNLTGPEAAILRHDIAA